MSKIVPTGAALGADITEIDPHSRDAPETVLEALHHHLVVRIRGADIDDLAFTRFASRFGQLEGSPAFSRSRPDYIPDAPLITVVSNVKENGVPIGEHGDGELNWHTDLGFMETPSGYTFLLARQVPPTGGDTRFCNLYNAYEHLDASTKQAIAALRIKHQKSHTAQGTPRPGFKDISTIDPRELPGPLHPIVRTHPHTGRKALYLGRRFGAYIPGLSLEDSERLLDGLWAKCGEAGNTWAQKWQVDDMIIWDNRATMHRREQFVGAGLRRMHRLTTLGEKPT
jgi:taurine dioxygenase